MAKKAMLIDTSRCMACRGCQVACKSWNELPALTTALNPSWTNPTDMSFNTYTVVRFKEVVQGGEMSWLFRKDQCRHCDEAGCLDSCPVDGAIVKTKSGAVVVTDKCVGGKGCNFECRDGCPYNIPRFREESGKPKTMAKCTFCFDRTDAGMMPACAKACGPEALVFGDRDEVQKIAQQRLAAVKKTNKNATLVDMESVGCFYLFKEKEDLYAVERKTPRKGIARLTSPLLLPLGVGSLALGALISRKEKVAREKESR